MKPLLVYIVLMLLLVVTYALAHIDLGSLNTPVSLLIAAIKAALVALFFMHLRTTKGVVRVAAIAGVFWLGILMALTFSDFSTRNWLNLPGGWPGIRTSLKD